MLRTLLAGFIAIWLGALSIALFFENHHSLAYSELHNNF